MFRCLFPIRIGAFVIGLTLIVGCGKKGGADMPDTVPVSGKITVDGEPVTEGLVTLAPFDKEQKTGGTPSGKIDPSGGYVLYTNGREGAAPGRYKVMVSRSTMPTGDKKPTTPFNSKFSNDKTSPLMITVKENPAPGDYDLKLTK